MKRLPLQVVENVKKRGRTPLGDRIDALAKEKGFSSLDRFAIEIGMPKSTLNNLIYGETEIFPSSLYKVADALDTEPVALIKESEMHNASKNPALIKVQLMQRILEMSDADAKVLWLQLLAEIGDDET